MFVGAINSVVRKFLAANAHHFNDKVVVVGCSGNFTSETIIAHYAKPAAIHANDISFYSCMAGAWLTGQPLKFEIVDSDYDWLGPFLESDISRLASIMVLLDMLEFVKRNNDHRVRMWNLYKQSFGDLVKRTIDRLNQVDLRLDSFFGGDVLTHFERFDNESDAVFCCYAPTYAGGYERMYKALDKIVQWNEPTYELLNDDRRDSLLNWMTGRSFLWYDDRLVEGMQPVMRQRAGLRRTFYSYSNLIKCPAFFDDRKVESLPKYPLAGADLELTHKTDIGLERIKTTELSRFKDAFLGKNIDHAQGFWGFVVWANDQVIGFLEFNRDPFDIGRIYMMADFPAPGTPYKRLSKLMVMLGISGQTRRMLERVSETRKRNLITTAFTDRPVSMKYRGVLNLLKRGQTEEGQKFLNYGAPFNELSWSETRDLWLTKHGSIIS